MTYRLPTLVLTLICLHASHAEAQPVGVVQFQVAVGATTTDLDFSKTGIVFSSERSNFTLDGNRTFTGVEASGTARVALRPHLALWASGAVGLLGRGNGTEPRINYSDATQARAAFGLETMLGKRSWKLRPFAQANIDVMWLSTDTDIRPAFRTITRVRPGRFFGIGVGLGGGAAYRLSERFETRLALHTARGNIDRFRPDTGESTVSTPDIGNASYSRYSIDLGIVYILPN